MITQISILEINYFTICSPEIYMHVGEKIRIARSMKGWNQDDLAEKINKTRALVSHIEITGKVQDDTYKQILDALGINEATLAMIVNDPAVIYNSSSKTASLIEENQRLKKEFSDLRREYDLLYDLVAYQKKLITLLEKGGKQTISGLKKENTPPDDRKPSKK